WLPLASPELLDESEPVEAEAAVAAVAAFFESLSACSLASLASPPLPGSAPPVTSPRGEVGSRAVGLVAVALVTGFTGARDFAGAAFFSPFAFVFFFVTATACAGASGAGVVVDVVVVVSVGGDAGASAVVTGGALGGAELGRTGSGRMTCT